MCGREHHHWIGFYISECQENIESSDWAVEAELRRRKRRRRKCNFVCSLKSISSHGFIIPPVVTGVGMKDEMIRFEYDLKYKVYFSFVVKCV